MKVVCRAANTLKPLASERHRDARLQ